MEAQATHTVKAVYHWQTDTPANIPCQNCNLTWKGTPPEGPFHVSYFYREGLDIHLGPNHMPASTRLLNSLIMKKIKGLIPKAFNSDIGACDMGMDHGFTVISCGKEKSLSSQERQQQVICEDMAAVFLESGCCRLIHC